MWIETVLHMAMMRSSRRQQWVRTHELPDSGEEETESWLSRMIADESEQQWIDRLTLDEMLSALSVREHVVVHAMLQGDSDAAIARRLHITTRTVRRIRAQIRARFRADRPTLYN